MKKVLVIGAAIIDILVSGADEAVFRTGTHPTEGIRLSYGGDALNEATGLAHLGVPVRLETVVGDDEAGRAVLRRMEAAGIPAEGVHIRSGLRTGVNVVLVRPDGERSFLTDPHGSLRALEMADITLPYPDDIGIVCFASLFVSPHLGISQMAELFRQAKSQGLITCADTLRSKRGERAADMAPLLTQLDYLVPSEDEALFLTGMETPEAAADEFLRGGAGTVIVKCGARGCYVKTGGAAYWVAAEPDVPCVDTTGAGDSFMAGFLSGLARELPLPDCVALGNRCGAKAVQHVGATTWTEV